MYTFLPNIAYKIKTQWKKKKNYKKLKVSCTINKKNKNIIQTRNETLFHVFFFHSFNYFETNFVFFFSFFMHGEEAFSCTRCVFFVSLGNCFFGEKVLKFIRTVRISHPGHTLFDIFYNSQQFFWTISKKKKPDVKRQHDIDFIFVDFWTISVTGNTANTITVPVYRVPLRIVFYDIRRF